MERGNWVIYRFYDDAENLLYVGISGRMGTRLKDHAHYQPWFPEVATIRLEHCGSEEAAREREMELIHSLFPRYNSVGLTKQLRQEYRPLVLPTNPRSRTADRTHCVHGHPFDSINTYIAPKGYRMCRICMRESGKRAFQRAVEQNRM